MDKLLKIAVKGETSTIGDICYDGGMLLKLLIEKMLGYPRKEFGIDEVAQLVITSQSVDCRLSNTLMYYTDYLEMPRDKVHVVSHIKGFIHYVLSQEKELQANQVGLFEPSDERLCYYEMRVQRGMRRNMVQAETQNQEEAFNLDTLDSPSGNRLADKVLTTCDERLSNRKLFSAVFLTGKDFKRQDWADGFMRLICNRRKVFVESCLFTRGVAYKGADYTHQEASHPYVFICERRLKVEVSLGVMRRGRESQPVVASYDNNWHESKSSMDLIVDRQEEIGFTISPLDSKKKKLVRIPLTGFPERPLGTTWVEPKVALINEGTMTVSIRDKGFGGLLPSSGVVVKQEVKL